MMRRSMGRAQVPSAQDSASHGQRAEDTKAGHAPSLGGFVASFLRLRLRQFCQMLFHRIFLEQMFPPF